MAIIATHQPIEKRYHRSDRQSGHDKIHGYDDGEAERAPARVDADWVEIEMGEELDYQLPKGIF